MRILRHEFQRRTLKNYRVVKMGKNKIPGGVIYRYVVRKEKCAFFFQRINFILVRGNHQISSIFVFQIDIPRVDVTNKTFDHLVVQVSYFNDSFSVFFEVVMKHSGQHGAARCKDQSVSFDCLLVAFDGNVRQSLVFPQIGKMEFIFFKIISTLTFLNLISLLFENRVFFYFLLVSAKFCCNLTYIL